MTEFKPYSIRIPDDLRQRLEAHAASQGEEPSVIARRALRHYLNGEGLGPIDIENLVAHAEKLAHGTTSTPTPIYTRPFQAEAIADMIAALEDKDLHAGALIVPPIVAADIRKWGRGLLDPVTSLDLQDAGLIGMIFGCPIISSKKTNGEIWMMSRARTKGQENIILRYAPETA